MGADKDKDARASDRRAKALPPRLLLRLLAQFPALASSERIAKYHFLLELLLRSLYTEQQPRVLARGAMESVGGINAFLTAYAECECMSSCERLFLVIFDHVTDEIRSQQPPREAMGGLPSLPSRSDKDSGDSDDGSQPKGRRPIRNPNGFDQGDLLAIAWAVYTGDCRIDLTVGLCCITSRLRSTPRAPLCFARSMASAQALWLLFAVRASCAAGGSPPAHCGSGSGGGGRAFGRA